MFKRLALVGIALVTASVCIRLGAWQLSRLAERRDRNNHIQEQLARKPLSAWNDLDADTLAYRRIVLAGRFDDTRPVIVIARSVRGVPAVYLVTSLVGSDKRALLVERGWAPSPDARSVDIAAMSEGDSSVVTGVLLPSGEASPPADPSWPVHVRRTDPSSLQTLFPYPLAPWILRRTELPPGAPSGLRAVPLPELSNGPHLSYAVQWFAFATIAVVGTVALLVSEKKNRVARGSTGR